MGLDVPKMDNFRHLGAQDSQRFGTVTPNYSSEAFNVTSVLDPDSGALWILVRIPNTDPGPHMYIVNIG